MGLEPSIAAGPPKGESGPAQPRAHSLLLVVLVALALRLIVVGFLYPERLNPDRDYWRFGGEVGRVARSLVQGKGFSSPMFADTGPTAWLTPVYPALLALVFRVFGVFTKASAICILSLNSLFSALTCLPVFFIARRTFGETTAWRAAWAWAFFPYAIYFAADFIWPTALTTLVLPVAFLSALALEESSRSWTWIRCGLITGFAALCDPIVMTALGPVGIWMCYRAYRHKWNWPRLALVAGVGFMLVVSPWFVRNYVTFHKVVPFRGNLGLELYSGNTDDTSRWSKGDLQPSHSEQEWQEYVQLGEMQYMQHKREQAVAFISTHKRLFVWVSLRRALYMWTNFWSLDPDYLREEPFELPAIFLNTTMSVLALWGLWIGRRTVGAAVAPYAIAMFFFPVVYYATHPEDYFRRPMDPIFVVLGAYAVTAWLQRRRLDHSVTSS